MSSRREGDKGASDQNEAAHQRHHPAARGFEQRTVPELGAGAVAEAERDAERSSAEGRGLVAAGRPHRKGAGGRRPDLRRRLRDGRPLTERRANTRRGAVRASLAGLAPILFTLSL